jgi:hypothetical protein
MQVCNIKECIKNVGSGAGAVPGGSGKMFLRVCFCRHVTSGRKKTISIHACLFVENM